jgi:hypothetical protein
VRIKKDFAKNYFFAQQKYQKKFYKKDFAKKYFLRNKNIRKKIL